MKLPCNWVWTTTQHLAALDSKAICAGPFGTIFKAKDFRSAGVPIIFLRHVGEGKYLTHKPGFMDESKWNELFQPYSVYGGELLVTKLGEPPGVCTIYPEGIGTAMVTPDVIKMSTNSAFVQSRYLMHYFNSETSKKFAFGVAYGVTRLRMNISIFRGLPIPLPPLEEQQLIVSDIDRIFSITDEIEDITDKGISRAEKLRQSILKKAFEGKLKTQDANDESASVLLERIQAEKKQKEIEKKGNKKAKAKKRKLPKNKRLELVEVPLKQEST